MRAIVAAGDPNPLVDGRGFDRLRAAGVEVVDGVLEEPSRRLNAAFERHVVIGTPARHPEERRVARRQDGRHGPVVPVDHG